MTEKSLSCPLPLNYAQIVMAHGGGGRLMQQLIENIIQPCFNPDGLAQNHDSAVIDIGAQKIAFTTDSYVINPLFFAGGDIGKLAVCGTVNDLAMSGAKPLHISCALIIEEGFAIADLQRILTSMQKSATQAGVTIVTGDTKVVEKGKGDGLYINTAGIGVIAPSVSVHPAHIRPGDSIIINSDLGRHGMAIMQQREGFDFDGQIKSDCAPLAEPVQNLINNGIEIHCLRDLTRGGLASILIELAQASQTEFEINEADLPVQSAVNSLCELLGFDPLYVANEGCFALFVPESQTAAALAYLHQSETCQQAVRIGHVTQSHDHGQVLLKTRLGIQRPLDLFSGEQLPRIC